MFSELEFDLDVKLDLSARDERRDDAKVKSKDRIIQQRHRVAK